MSMLFIDFQDLDAVNKDFGRPAGDAALVVVADVLRETLRSADIPARMRGDDFAILLPDTEENEVASVIARIRAELDTRVERQQLPFGLSIRISRATIDPSADDFSLESLIALADAAS
jgi:diguanylate cyclase (GGDEF)-like protein